MTARSFLCPQTEEPCVRDGCTTTVCVAQTMEDANFKESQARAKERRLRARINPATGRLELPGKPEEYGL